MASQSTSGKALLYFSERVEDATEAVKGLISGRVGSATGGIGYAGDGTAAGALTSSRYLDAPDDILRAQLESDRDDVRISGLRTVVAHISKGRDASGYFASVVKLSSNHNLEIRKLVYCIVRRYARKQPDVALLGINSFQRDLLDRNEVVRMMALRVLTGLDLKVAASVVEYALARSVRDTSAHVRRAAALSLIKSHKYSDSLTLKAHLNVLLQDRHPSVLGAALVAWKMLFSDDVSLLHQHYRKLCFALSDLDEWSQHQALSVLGVYAKRCFRKADIETGTDPDLKLFVSKAGHLLQSRNPAVVSLALQILMTVGGKDYGSQLKYPALRLVHEPSEISLFGLINCIALAQAYPHSFDDELHNFIPRSSNIEPGYITVLKLRMMISIANQETFEEVVAEALEQAQYHPSDYVAEFAVQSIGILALDCTEAQKRFCVRKLLFLVQSRSSRAAIVSEALVVLEQVVERSNDEEAVVIVYKLSQLLFSASSTASKDSTKRIKIVGKSAIQAPRARAAIFWMLGQHCRSLVPLQKGDLKISRSLAEIAALDVLRLASINFCKEETCAKLQIVTLSTKLVTVAPRLLEIAALSQKLLQIHRYIMQLARYDVDYDVRDRSRFCKALADRLDGPQENPDGKREGDDDDAREPHLGGVVLRRSQVEHVLFEHKRRSTGKEEPDAAMTNVRLVQSLEHLIGSNRSAAQSSHLIDFISEPWADEQTLPSPDVREPPQEPAGLSKQESELANALRASTQKSLASEDWMAGGSSGAQTPVTSSRADLLRQNSMRPPSAQQQVPSNAMYKDLDSFLNAESEGEDSNASFENSPNGQDTSEEEEYEEEGDGADAEEEEEYEEEEAESEDTDDEESTSASQVGALLTDKVQLQPPSEEQNAWAST